MLTIISGLFSNFHADLFTQFTVNCECDRRLLFCCERKFEERNMSDTSETEADPNAASTGSESPVGSMGATAPARRGTGGRGVRTRGGGRGRQRGGRGRGRGRGRGGQPAQMIIDRRSRMRTIIDTVDEQRLRALFCQMVDRYPSLVFDLLEEPDQGHSPPAGETAQPDWCTCGNCRTMPTPIEDVCCRKTTCPTTLGYFELIVLDETVLRVARSYRRDMIRIEDGDDEKRANRHAAYRQFILWMYGRLGAGQRRVIPSCCVLKIREKFPDARGNYTGFLAGRFGD